MTLMPETIFAIKMLYATGYTVGEIARELDIPESIVVKVLEITK